MANDDLSFGEDAAISASHPTWLLWYFDRQRKQLFD
jgi:hypothetical protein